MKSIELVDIVLQLVWFDCYKKNFSNKTAYSVYSTIMFKSTAEFFKLVKVSLEF